jgi:hypothetical protein
MDELTEEEIVKLEEEFPLLAAEAFRTARQEALDAGFSVLASDGNGHLVETFPDGSRIIRGTLPLPTRVKPGTKIRLR